MFLAGARHRPSRPDFAFRRRCFERRQRLRRCFERRQKLRRRTRFSGALRQRLALKAAATCARLARLREDEAALRDAEHLAAAASTPALPDACIACFGSLRRAA